MADYYRPDTKYKLVELLTQYWPEDKAKLARMTKAQLYAIWYKKCLAR